MQLSEFERLVRLYQDRVYGYACYMLGRREDAQDVAQDVLLRLWKRGDTVDADRVAPWLMRVTRNACIDRLRHRRTVRDVVEAEVDVERIAHNEPLPGDGMEHDDERRMLDRALEGMKEPYRSVVILREIQELKYEEISGAMDMPLNTVKVYLHRGRKMLREQLIEVMERERV